MEFDKGDSKQSRKRSRQNTTEKFSLRVSSLNLRIWVDSEM
jgi:hypothetical protein